MATTITTENMPAVGIIARALISDRNPNAGAYYVDMLKRAAYAADSGHVATALESLNEALAELDGVTAPPVAAWPL